MATEKEKHIDRLSDQGQEFTVFGCSKGHHEEFVGDSYYAAKLAVEKGWRATNHGNTYCPPCAKKYLKPKTKKK
jgi:hypothetical protein